MTSSVQKGRAALRVATRSLHERLHESPSFAALTEQRLDLAGYRRLLTRQASCYFSAARNVAVEPHRLALLESDLVAVEAEPFKVFEWTLPSCHSEALGWRYVVDGSIFGGRVIYRQLDYLFGDRDAGRSFFRGTADGTRHWTRLCQELEQRAQEPGQLDRMTHGARDAFRAFGEILDIKEPAPV